MNSAIYLFFIFKFLSFNGRLLFSLVSKFFRTLFFFFFFFSFSLVSQFPSKCLKKSLNQMKNAIYLICDWYGMVHMD
jgi:hypothetical protein